MIFKEKFRLIVCLCSLACILAGHTQDAFPAAFPGKHQPNLRSLESDHTQEEAVEGMLKRLLPDHHLNFSIKVDSTFATNDLDTFKIVSPVSANDSRVGVTGTTGVTAAWGVLYYLKYFCNSHVSWEANQLHIPNPLPSAYVKISSLDRFRYYQNVCTSSYSFVWWDWEQWERHIDWMALNGINFPLAFTAQEAIWRNVYRKFNFTDEDLDDHFAGPAFLAWGRMGNIKKWGGPLHESWHVRSLELQHRILNRMREFGMIPILPAFGGHVPPAITRIYPTAKVTRLEAWGKFVSDEYTRTYLLDPRDPLFTQIGSEFIAEMQREYNGTSHAYNCDTFNEMTPQNNTPSYLRSVGKAIFKAMTKSDPEAIWVMQGWLFMDNFWTTTNAKALLTSVPQGRMIVLDLFADESPQYARLNSFFGQPFIFCMLHNFGGVDGMYGNADSLMWHLKNARSFPNGTLVGAGLTPEGINQNYVIYDFMLELSWRKEVNISEWAEEYATRRYNRNSENLREAWKILMGSVYNSIIPQFHGSDFIQESSDSHKRSSWAVVSNSYALKFHGQGDLLQHRPDFIRKSSLWYNKDDLIAAWDLFMIDARAITKELADIGNNQHFQQPANIHSSLLSESYLEKAHFSENHINFGIIEQNGSDNNETSFIGNTSQLETFRHDLVDITRQVMMVLGNDLILNLRKAYENKSEWGVNVTGNFLLGLIDDIDMLLATSKDFLLGSWLTQASDCSTSNEEEKQYIVNALHQITIWGPNGEILDYAIKQWNGVFKNYLKPRWKLFMDVLLECLKEDQPFNQKEFNTMVFILVEKPFADAFNHTFTATTKGDAIAVTNLLYNKYRAQFKSSNNGM